MDLSNDLEPNNIHRRSTKFKELCQQKHCQLGLKQTEIALNKKRSLSPSPPPNSTDRNQAQKTTQLQTHVAFHEKGKMAKKAKTRIGPRAMENYSQALSPNQEIANLC